MPFGLMMMNCFVSGRDREYELTKKTRGDLDGYEPDPVVRICTYRKISNISHTKSQNLNDSRLVLLLS